MLCGDVVVDGVAVAVGAAAAVAVDVDVAGVVVGVVGGGVVDVALVVVAL